MPINFLFLPVLCLIGVITAWQDIKYGKIKNRWIIIGLAWGLGCYFLLLTMNLVAGKEFLTLFYVKESLINSSIALALGYLLWRLDFWSAGDAKLFFVFSLLLPLNYYQKSYLPIFPSFALLVNIFLPVFIFLALCSFLFVIKSLSKKLLISPQKNFKDFLLFFENKIKKDGRTILGGGLGMILAFSFLLIIRQKIQGAVSTDPAISGFVLICIILIFSKQIFGFLRKKTVLKAVSVILILWLGYGLAFESEQVFGMLLAIFRTLAIFILLLGLVKKTTDFYIEQSKEKKMPFAFWMAIGVAITIFLKTSLLSFVIPLIR